MEGPGPIRWKRNNKTQIKLMENKQKRNGKPDSEKRQLKADREDPSAKRRERTKESLEAKKVEYKKKMKYIFIGKEASQEKMVGARRVLANQRTTRLQPYKRNRMRQKSSLQGSREVERPTKMFGSGSVSFVSYPQTLAK